MAFFDREAVRACAVAAVTLALFLPAVACDFVNWDDNSYVYDNPLVLRGLSADGVRRALTETVFGGWMPLTIVSYQLDATLAGEQPWCYHLTNVVVHAVSAGLLAVALARMTASPAKATVAALVFALHPLRVESVAWVSERKDVLSVLFMIVALLAYEGYCRRPGVIRYLGVFAALLCSLLAKSTLVTMPLLLALCDVWPLRRVRLPAAGRAGDDATGTRRYPSVPWSRAILEKLPLVGLSFIFSRITLATQSAFLVSPAGLSFSRARLPNAIEAVGFYCRKTLLPSDLHPAIYHTGTDRDWTALGVGAAALVGLVVAALVAHRRLPAVTWGVAWFGVSLLPVLGFVQTGFHAYADRFTYVPHVGLSVAAVWAAAAAARRLALPRWTVGVAAALVVIALASASLRQIAVWKDGRTLWTHVLRIEPEHPIALAKLANLAGLAGNHREAERLYVASLRGQEYGWVIASLARTYHRLGDEEKMRQYRDWATRIAANDPEVARILAEVPGGTAQPRSPPQPPRPPSAVRPLLERGSVSLAANRFAEALQAFDEAAAADGRCGAAYNLAGIALVGLDRHAEAERRFSRATQLEPEHAGYWVNLAQVRSNLLDWAGCIAACDGALAIDPANVEVRVLRDRAADKRAGR